MESYGREDETQEFKRSTSELAEGLVSITAMLNKNCRGTVYFGVDDSGAVVGQQIGKKTLRDISQAVATSIEPVVVPSIDLLKTEDGRQYVRLSAHGTERPYLCKGVAYVRSGEEDRRAPLSELKKMIYSSGDHLVETLSSNQHLTFSGLCGILGENGLDVTDVDRLCNSFHLKNSDDKFNLMAELVSDQNPYPLTVAVFSGVDRSRLILRKDYSGKSLLLCVKDVLEYMSSLNETSVDVTGPVRKEVSMFDFPAFKEAWVNACVHNNWLTYTPPAVHVFDDRLEIISYGDKPYWLSMDEFYSGKSMPVNESLMLLFTSAHIAEHTGHGVPVVVDSYGRGSYEFNGGSICVRLKFSARRLPARLREDAVKGLTPRDVLILTTLKSRPDITLRDVAEQTGIGLSTVQKTVPRLRSMGLVERKGSKNHGVWEVHYDG